MRHLRAVAAALALTGCAGQPLQSEGEYRREQVARTHQRGSDAALRGEYGRALGQYEQAYDQARSLEDGDAVAVNLLNMAALLHRSGEFAAARDRLLQVVEHNPPLPAAFVGRAEARLALIELQMGRPAEAAVRADRAERLCTGADCAWRAALLNVRAAIRLRDGDVAAAESRAREALAAARGKDEREEANAWRTLATAAASAGRTDESRKHWLAALDIDRRIGAPERTVLDLLGLARLELNAGEREAARNYARRAAEIAEGARLAAPATAARALLREAQ